MKVKKEREGRIAVEWIKDQYRSGRVWQSAEEIREGLHLACGGIRKIAKCTTAHARDWDRQARYEWAKEGGYVSTPQAKTRRVRDPNASPKLRQASESAANRELSTRLSNRVLLLGAASLQPDASPSEIRKAERAAMALEIFSSIEKVVADPAFDSALIRR